MVDWSIPNAVTALESLSVHELSQVEGLSIGDPDGPGTPGARFLKDIRDRLVAEVVNFERFPDPEEDDFEFQASSDQVLPGDREAWQAFAELCMFDSPYLVSGLGEHRLLDTDGARMALEMMGEKLIRLLILRYSPNVNREA